MNTPEQPAVWPPAPTLPPPEAEKAKPFKPKLALPEWADYWLICSSRCGIGVCIFGLFIHQNFHFRPHWDSVIGMLCLGIVMGGLMTAWKFRPKNNKK